LINPKLVATVSKLMGSEEKKWEFDAKGRITLPKAIRDELNVEDGTPFFVKFIRGKN